MLSVYSLDSVSDKDRLFDVVLVEDAALLLLDEFSVPLLDGVSFCLEVEGGTFLLEDDAWFLREAAVRITGRGLGASVGCVITTTGSSVSIEVAPAVVGTSSTVFSRGRFSSLNTFYITGKNNNPQISSNQSTG